MDPNVIVQLLRQTLIPNAREQAENELNKVHKIIGFCPTLLKIIMAEDLEIPVRQAGVIYFKNILNQAWMVREEERPGQPLAFSIHEQDKGQIRATLIEAMVSTPEVIRTQLGVCTLLVIKHDFPHKWTDVDDQIHIRLQTPEPKFWPGALLALYQLVKNYEYKKKEERAPLNDTMRKLLPTLYDMSVSLFDQRDQPFEEIKKQILKIFFGFTQYVFPVDILNRDIFPQWMELFKRVIEQDVPVKVMEVDEEERPQVIWWKIKKWALHIITRIFERYGSPGNVAGEYKDFSEWYLRTFSKAILETILGVLHQYRSGVYVSPRVMQQALNYLNTAVSHAQTWKLIKPHILDIIKDIVFPLMSYTEQDAELWESDPYEYIRIKFDIFEDFVSPVTAAQTLLHSVCKKRKDVLPRTMETLLAIVQGAQTTPAQKDGALHMIGTMADILLKKKIYKDQMETFLSKIVFAEFSSPHGHLRARACWMLHYFADVKYKDPSVLQHAFKLTIDKLLTDKEPPVKVEAAIALQMMLTSQGEVARPFVGPQIREITRKLLDVIRETENDDLTSVMQKIVCTYTEQLIPEAQAMCEELVKIFAQVLDSGDAGDEKAITAMGLLNTMETILNVMEDKEVHTALEPIVLQAVHHIFTKSIMEFYEEALSLTCDLTTTKISENMWNMLDVIYAVFDRDGFDYFTDMMPTLHNYVTVDTEAFLNRPRGPESGLTPMEVMFKMCERILTSDPGEDPECHAAKLLEVILLQCRGANINAVIAEFLRVVFTRLNREIKTSELRTMCLQVAIAAMYYNAEWFFRTLKEMDESGMIIKKFIEQWLHDTDCFIGLHDRKICVIGLCQLMTLHKDIPGVAENGNRLIPCLLLLFSGLKRAYELQAAEEDSDSSDDEEDDDDNDEILNSDEDEIDEQGQMYLESLQEKIMKSPLGNFNISASLEDDDDDSDEEDDLFEETSLESYVTPIDDETTGVDEYQVFAEVIASIEQTDPNWHQTLFGGLSNDDRKSLQDVMTLCQQRRAARESRSIEQQGGYQFAQQTVPGAFNFAGPASNFTFGKN